MKYRNRTVGAWELTCLLSVACGGVGAHRLGGDEMDEADSHRGGSAPWAGSKGRYDGMGSGSTSGGAGTGSTTREHLSGGDAAVGGASNVTGTTAALATGGTAAAFTTGGTTAALTTGGSTNGGSSSRPDSSIGGTTSVQCESEGATRCLGNAQRGREACGSGIYQRLADCPDGQLCDSGTGECLPILPECAGHAPGYAYCEGPRELRVCGNDLVSIKTSNTCEFRCIEGDTGAGCGGAICGDKIRQHGEECDDGNTQDGDDCPADCQIPVRALMAGETHACALGDNGVLKCWGSNETCQLGIGASGNRGDEPNEMGDELPGVNLGSLGITSNIVGGMVFGCALLENGRVKCWGSGIDGELGFGTTETRGCDAAGMGDALPPVELGSGVTAVELMAGFRHVCARTADARVKCWGTNLGGELGLGNATFNALDWGDDPSRIGDALPFVPLTSSGLAVRAIGGGYAQSCAIFSDDRLKCWGYNVEGELGIGLPLRNDTEAETHFIGDDAGEMGDALPFVRLPTGRKPVTVIGGDFDMCALLDDGSVVCWGQGVGDAPEEMGDNLAPVPLGTGRTAKMLAKNRYHQCVVLDNGGVKCWGRSGFALGLGDPRPRVAMSDLGDNLPQVDLGTGRTALSVAVGNGFTCALLDDRTVKCWGLNSAGALGLGDTEDRGDEPGEMGDALPTVDLAF